MDLKYIFHYIQIVGRVYKPNLSFSATHDQNLESMLLQHTYDCEVKTVKLFFELLSQLKSEGWLGHTADAAKSVCSVTFLGQPSQIQNLLLIFH